MYKILGDGCKLKVSNPLMKKMKKFLKENFCKHYWRSISSDVPGMICIKCKKIKGEIHDDLWD